MKKLIVLSAVFAVAPLAVATLFFFADDVILNDGDTISAGAELSMRFSAPDFSYTITIDAAGDVTMDTTGIYFNDIDPYPIFICDPKAASVRLTGSSFMTPVNPDPVWGGIIVNGTNGFLAFNDLGSGTETLIVNVVPEPMTMVILGAGCLFIRKYNK